MNWDLKIRTNERKQAITLNSTANRLKYNSNSLTERKNLTKLENYKMLITANNNKKTIQSKSNNVSKQKNSHNSNLSHNNASVSINKSFKSTFNKITNKIILSINNANQLKANNYNKNFKNGGIFKSVNGKNMSHNMCNDVPKNPVNMKLDPNSKANNSTILKLK